MTLLLLALACTAPPDGDPAADTAAAEQLPLFPVGVPTILDVAIQDDLGPSTDLDGDGRADLCGRANGGLQCYLSDGTAFPTLVTSSLFGDAAGWTDGTNYRTIRFGDISGDGRADVCARADSGMQCHLSTGSGWITQPILGPAWSDAMGWNVSYRYGSIRMVDVDVDGKQDLCALDGANMLCARSLGLAFAPAEPGAFMDWVDPSSTMEWGSLSWGDLDGNTLPDFCFINDNVVTPGLVCWLQVSTGVWSTDIQTGGGWTPANGWDGSDQWSTVRFDTVGDERRRRLIGRGANGIEVARWSSGPVELVTERVLSSLTDAQGYTDAANYSTLRAGDITGDGLGDLCVRADAGMRCHVQRADGSYDPTAISGPAWSDANGWGTEDKFLTIRLADVDGDGKQDLCGRGSDGFRCARSTGTGFTAESPRVGWTDAGGWNQEDNFIPTHLAGSIPDRDGDGVYDAFDGCPGDGGKVTPGVCGCGVADANNDGDALPNCVDGCPYDPGKLDPGQCGCYVADADADADLTADCVDGCATDPAKTDPGSCGCGVADTDADGDLTADCVDGCPTDPAKTAPGTCGCGVVDDADADGFADCLPCGDGVRGAGEACDDGGHVAGDGCSPTCALEDLAVVEMNPGSAGVRNTITVGGATPGAGVTLLVATQAGSTALPGCPGVSVPLRAPTVLGTKPATGASRAVFTVTPPANFAGRDVRLVAVELARCAVSAAWVERL